MQKGASLEAGWLQGLQAADGEQAEGNCVAESSPAEHVNQVEACKTGKGTRDVQLPALRLMLSLRTRIVAKTEFRALHGESFRKTPVS